ncbi:MAG: hypothetical protein IPG07_10610 [Crocinitomicaceae bacterium]|nr:hypothetical protein [Crocinitomicaceae bacterium]
MLSLFLIGFSNSIGQINCDSEWVKQKGICSVIIAGEDLAGGHYSEYFEYALSGNIIYYEKSHDNDKFVMQFNYEELLITEIYFKSTDTQPAKWDTSKVYSYSYDSTNNLKTWTLRSLTLEMTSCA